MTDQCSSMRTALSFRWASAPAPRHQRIATTDYDLNKQYNRTDTTP